MRLIDMKPDFNSLDPHGQMGIFQDYITKRTHDMTMAIVQPRSKGKRKAKGKQVKLTNEQYALLQKLGLV